MSQTGAIEAAPLRRWRFGRAEFDERSLNLKIDGRTVELEPKPLRVLQHFLHHAGEVVGKDALIRAAWPGRIISDAALAKCIARLRDALGDREQTLIKTQHRYGYKLVAPVAVEHSAPLEPTPARALTAVPHTPNAYPSSSEPREAEHRPLTMLFCDLVGSTQLAETLDPETFRNLLIAYRRRVSEISTRYEGHLAQQLGDGLLIYFGYPFAHDDDAERALRCACALLVELDTAHDGSRLRLRIGVHSSRIAIGSSADPREIFAAGSGLHLAARLQALAEPDTILCSDATFRLVPGLFVTRDFGPQEIRGLREPVRVQQVLMPSGVRSRLEAAASLTPFVGRERERARLAEAWNKAVNGTGQALLISGEPGIGKSRLLMLARERLAGSAHTWLECRASALTRQSAYQPPLELLHLGLAMREDDSDEQKLQRLELGFAALGLDCAETIPLLAPLLNLPDCYAPSALGPELKRRRTLEALTNWVLRLSHQQPLVIAFEDLHWADESSLACLSLLVKRLADVPILLLMTARPEFAALWPAESSLTQLTLDPLPNGDVEQMLGSLSAATPLSPELLRLIGLRSGGVPLFIEELARALLDPAIPQLAIPDSLQGLLMARLDRLGSARELIQIAAVIGREVPLRLLEQVSRLDEADLTRRLDTLVESGFLHPCGTPSDPTYVFKHALIQDAAYETLLKSARQRWHGRVADALEQHFKLRATADPVVLAQHFELAGSTERAVHYYKLAGEASQLRAAVAESVAHLERALELLAGLPSGAQRDRMELDLSLSLGTSITAAHGFGDVKAERAATRAYELCASVDDPVLLGRALNSLWWVSGNRGEFELSLQFAHQLRDLGEKMSAPLLQGVGNMLAGAMYFFMGQPELTGERTNSALKIASPAIAKLSIAHGQDLRSSSLVARAWSLWALGNPEQAWATANEALAQAESNAHPYSIGFARTFGLSMLSIFRREPTQAMAQSAASLDYSERFGFLELTEHSRLNLAVGLGLSGRADEGLAMLRPVIAQRLARGALAWRAFYACMEAQLCLQIGRYGEAGEALTIAFHFCKRGHRDAESELHRVKGEWLLADANDTAGAEACFRKALEVSRAQQAKSLELRAATSLARLWQQQDRRQDAIELLRPVYAGFTEGFDTPDLIEARGQMLAIRSKP